jgi:hypothetical protein
MQMQIKRQFARSARARRFGVCAALFVAVSAPGTASAMVVCWVKKTSDGFVALRAQPSPEGRLIAKMRGGDVVWGDPDSKVKDRNGWTYVNWVKKSTHEATGGVTVKIDGKGWVRASLIEDECG